MQLRRLGWHGFRNLAPRAADAALDVDARYVVFHGANAQGKTNALEAIYLLASLKPLRARRSRELVRWGDTAAAVFGDAEHGGSVRHYRVDVGLTGREGTVDGKPAASLPAYFSGIRAIAFVPGDTAVVGGEPALRRSWLDRAAFTAAPAHLDVVRAYRRAVEQKGAALRGGADDRVLDAIDGGLVELGVQLVQRRSRLIAELAPHVVRTHHALAGSGDVTVRYRTQVVGDDADAMRRTLRASLAEARPRERERQVVIAGPQTDDVEIVLAGHSVRAWGSQGQVRTAVLALKLAELLAARDRDEVPLFLLDDVGSELDATRTARLVGLVHELGAQTFLTTTDADRVHGLPSAETRRFRVVDGEVVSEA